MPLEGAASAASTNTLHAEPASTIIATPVGNPSQPPSAEGQLTHDQLVIADFKEWMKEYERGFQHAWIATEWMSKGLYVLGWVALLGLLVWSFGRLRHTLHAYKARNWAYDVGREAQNEAVVAQAYLRAGLPAKQVGPEIGLRGFREIRRNHERQRHRMVLDSQGRSMRLKEKMTPSGDWVVVPDVAVAVPGANRRKSSAPAPVTSASLGASGKRVRKDLDFARRVPWPQERVLLWTAVLILFVCAIILWILGRGMWD